MRINLAIPCGRLKDAYREDGDLTKQEWLEQIESMGNGRFKIINVSLEYGL